MLFWREKINKGDIRYSRKKEDDIRYKNCREEVDWGSGCNSFHPEDKFCPNCGNRLEKFTNRIEYDRQTGEKIRIVNMQCKDCLPYGL